MCWLQVVDMRWGVREEASIDHSSSDLCIKEIKTCNEVSLGPTFVVRTVVDFLYCGNVLIKRPIGIGYGIGYRLPVKLMTYVHF